MECVAFRFESSRSMKNDVAVFFMDLEPFNMKSYTFLRNVGIPDQAKQRHIPEDQNRFQFGFNLTHYQVHSIQSTRLL
jgi:hypothetical protein